MAVWCTLSQFGTPRPGMTLPCRFSYTWFSFYMWHTLYCGVRILSWYSTGTLFGNAVIRLAASWFDVPREAQINRLSSFDITSLKVQANIVCRAAKTTVTTHTRRAKINIIERLVQIFRDSCNAVLNGEVRTTRKNILTIFRIGDTCLVEADLFKSMSGHRKYHSQSKTNVIRSIGIQRCGSDLHAALYVHASDLKLRYGNITFREMPLNLWMD